MRHFLPSVALASIALFVIWQPALANSSAYTKFNIKKCRSLAKDELGGSMQCPGYRNYPVFFTEGDLRESMRYGPAARDLVFESFESFGNFNSANDTIEWRLDGAGKPFAAIQRWHIDYIDPDTGASSPKSGGQVLVVSRVAQPDDGLSCVVSYVDALANANANELAREVADRKASDFVCGIQEPMWAGVRGGKSSEPMRSLPDRLREK